MKHPARMTELDTEKLGRAFKTLASMQRTRSGKPIMYPKHIADAIEAACNAVQDVLTISNKGKQ